MRAGAVAQQHFRAVEVRLIEIDLRLLGRGVAQHALIVLLHRIKRGRDLRQIGCGVVDGDLELPGIETIENLPRRHILIVGDLDVLHDAGDVGRDSDLLGVDIGIVGRHHLTAGDVPVTGDDENKRQQRKQRPANPLPSSQPV